MALVLLGRRLPMLRYLSALAANRSDFVSGIHSSCNSLNNNTAGTETLSSVPAKQDLGKASSDSPAATEGATMTTSAGTQPPSTSQPTTVDDDDEWTEVVHSSGQLYYWNQRTGETTQLGEPKPKSDRSGSGGGAGKGGERTHEGGPGRGADAHVDPRAEAHLEDRTGTYASIGVIIGAFLGWVSQFV
ncbi:hypothetical protein Vretimale_8001 [Volvox reticuliferus]|uniref:WW domain-containing protein n=1 Tax=Volvox reticuliferus TaxID=1737510 RepID=A0A8J4G9W9_9CHLO|nr:hypothetical protein Vretifemale_5129 [Volvox reticuliferus]GIM03184.1 hypothetical protein Vretimale_8001 [Volvox reticuliferus]